MQLRKMWKGYKKRSPPFVHKVDNSTRATSCQVSYSGDDKMPGMTNALAMTAG